MDVGSRDLGTFPTRWQHDLGNLQQDPAFLGKGCPDLSQKGLQHKIQFQYEMVF